MTTARPDWYPDPSNSALERWWTGNTWSEYTRPAMGFAAPTAPGQYPYVGPGAVAAPLLGPITRGGVFGIISVVINPLLIFSILGIAYSILGLRRARQIRDAGYPRTGYGWNIAGVITSCVGAISTIAGYVFLALHLATTIGSTQ